MWNNASYAFELVLDANMWGVHREARGLDQLPDGRIPSLLRVCCLFIEWGRDGSGCDDRGPFTNLVECVLAELVLPTPMVLANFDACRIAAAAQRRNAIELPQLLWGSVCAAT